MTIRRTFAALGAVPAAALLAVAAAAPASANEAVHSAKIKKNGYINTAGTIRIEEAGDKVKLCDAADIKGYVIAYFFWGDNHTPFKAKITDGKDRGCGYSSATGKGSAKKVNLPEGRRITIKAVAWDGGTAGEVNLTFKNDH